MSTALEEVVINHRFSGQKLVVVVTVAAAVAAAILAANDDGDLVASGVFVMKARRA